VVNTERWVVNVFEELTLKGHDVWNSGKTDQQQTVLFTRKLLDELL